MTDDQQSATAYCDVEHNIIVVVVGRPRILTDSTKASFSVGQMTATVTTEDANTIVVIWYDSERDVMRIAKTKESSGLAGAVQDAYQSMPRGQSIVSLITAHMTAPDVEVFGAEYAAIQRQGK